MKKLLWFLAGILSVELLLKAVKQHKNNISKYRDITKRQTKACLPRVNFVSKNITTTHTQHSWKRFFRDEPTAIALIGLAVLLVVFQSGMEKFSTFFQASMIEWEQQAEPFNGTVSPIEKVPNWVDLSDNERTISFDELSDSKKIITPDYNIAAMKIGMTWRRDNKDERNTYITYPVPNLGNYELDATEDSGSHTGLDIKTLIGTPVRSISQGIVIRSENQPTGFGQHIVIMHVDVPDPEYPGQTTNLFSIYAHLSARHVQPGDAVEKGEVIGKTGMSGMATAPHLHFQIDRQNAPFHPYWPFTWKDLQASNINSYFEAVKQGVNADRAKKYTVHPMQLIVSNINYDQNAQNLIVSADPTFIPTPEPIHSAAPTVTVPEKKTLTIDDSKAVIKKTYTERKTSTGRRTRLSNGETIKVETDRTFRPGTPETFDIIIADDTLVANAGIKIGTTLRDFADITPKVLTNDDFKNGVAQVQVTTDSNSTFKLIASGDFGEIRSQSLRAQIFTDVSASHRNQEAIAFVQQKKIMNGYGDGSFKPNGQLNRAEAVKILITANELSLLPAETNFADVDASAWYAPHVATALARGLVKGYGDGSFKPGNTISRAEFLKVAVEAAKVMVPIEFNKPYPDINMGAWYAPYFAIAAKNNLLPAVRGGSIVPQQAITRSEAANIIWKLLQLKR